MKILKNVKVPTGNILIVEGSQGKLECLSLSDYGKGQNIKADFLGFTKEIQGVPHGDPMPLSKKWVCTISPQYGCSMGCPYCDVPNVGPGRNASLNDMIGQVLSVLHLHPEIKRTERFNIHFARMGEPAFNPDVLEAAKWFYDHLMRDEAGQTMYRVHPVVSTIMPRNNRWLRTFIHNWMRIKNRLYGGEAGLQVSLNSTDEDQRGFLFGGSACTLPEVADAMRGVYCHGRKIALNIALCSDSIVEPDVMLRYFSPETYMVKITPLHETRACEKNNLHTPEGYIEYTAYRPLEEKLKKAGYDVLVFVPSLEEDESRITCGNAILSEEKHCQSSK